MILRNNHTHRSFLEIKFNKNLNGLEVKSTLNQYQTSDDINSDNIYGNWTFPTIFSWGDYWKSSNRRTLGKSKSFTIGKESVKVQNLYCKHEVFIKENQVVNSTILGIPNSWTNDTDKVLKLHKILDLDQNGELWMNDEFATSSIIFNIRSNFMVETHIFIFYSASTFFSKLGGYYASFTALFSYLAPIFMLYFLYNLALIIKQQRRKKYVSELKLTTHRFL